ncbi:TolC family protein [Paludibacterium sp. B53371]|uniref:TolC family protein n=1 Tax=Paludibacterium sp. B53371 TaxID=2806263 RepID=UPI001C046F95|nr:TolC family protein [Paludibacterium sp. B53371]
MKAWLSGLLALGCVGCAMSPPPAVTVCDTRSEQTLAWWQGFADPRLLGYLAEAGRCNLELAQKARLIARQRQSLAEGDWRPRGRMSADVGQSLDGGELRHGHTLDLAVGYELDVWQRLRLGKQAEAHAVEAAELDRQALWLSLQAEVAMRYWDWVALRRQQVLAGQVVEVRQALRELDQLAVRHGSLAPRQRHESEMAWLQARERQSQLSHQVEQAAERLAALLDRPGLSDLPGADTLPAQWPALPADQPAAVLARRPDVAAQSARVAAAWAKLVQARQALMPTVTLSATLGAASPTLKGLLAQSAAGGVLQLGLPFLDWSGMGIQREQLRLAWEQATLAYEQTLRRALRELALALRHQPLLEQDVQRVEARLALQRQQERRAELAVSAGASAQTERLLVRLQGLQLASAQVDLLHARASHLALLYKVLGGPPQALVSPGAGE